MSDMEDPMMHTTPDTSPADDHSPTQLTLLPRPSTPVQFRLDEATRERGRCEATSV